MNRRVSRDTRRFMAVAACVLGAIGAPAGAPHPSFAQVEAQDRVVYRPKLAIPETVEPFLKDLEPGNDAFPAEREASELAARLAELGSSLRAGVGRPVKVAEGFFASDFRGGRLRPIDDGSSRGEAVFEVRRAKAVRETALETRRADADLPGELSLDSRAFIAELGRLIEGMREIAVAEFQVTSIETVSGSNLVRTRVRYDIVGPGTAAWRIQHVGGWVMSWRKDPSGWHVVEWSADSDLTGRARRPVFTEITQAVLGANDSFARQLNTGLDAWMGSIDTVLTRDSNGHHGISVGDADGDGLDDSTSPSLPGCPTGCIVRAVTRLSRT